MNNQYAVSIRHIYTMPDETFNGYELVLWHWDVIENTWLFRATRDYPISKRVSRGCALWKALGDAQELARIFQCKNYDGMTTAYEHVINYCQFLLGYSGSMPSEVPNQSEDAK